jgi:hypothetical protein
MIWIILRDHETQYSSPAQSTRSQAAAHSWLAHVKAVDFFSSFLSFFPSFLLPVAFFSLPLLLPARQLRTRTHTNTMTNKNEHEHDEHENTNSVEEKDATATATILMGVGDDGVSES